MYKIEGNGFTMIESKHYEFNNLIENAQKMEQLNKSNLVKGVSAIATGLSMMGVGIGTAVIRHRKGLSINRPIIRPFK